MNKPRSSVRAQMTICVMLIACTSAGCAPRVGPGDYPTPAGAHAAAGGTAHGLIDGSINHRSRMPLPPDAVVDVWVTDSSPGLTAAAVLADTTIEVAGRQVPIPFALRFDARRVEPDHLYSLKAAIRSGDQTLFASTHDTRVLTRGNPNRVDLVLPRAAGGGSPSTGNSGVADDPLHGTSWRLDDLAGAGVIDLAEATLEFTERGKIAGQGSCNRFFGTVRIAGSSITCGPLGGTRMACTGAVNDQETRYFAALAAAERFTVGTEGLAVYCRGLAAPLRFTRISP